MSRITPEPFRDKAISATAQESFKLPYKPVIYRFSDAKETNAASDASNSARSIDTDFSATISETKNKEGAICNGYK
jgi:hypothetical protein